MKTSSPRWNYIDDDTWRSAQIVVRLPIVPMTDSTEAVKAPTWCEHHIGNPLYYIIFLLTKLNWLQCLITEVHLGDNFSVLNIENSHLVNKLFDHPNMMVLLCSWDGDFSLGRCSHWTAALYPRHSPVLTLSFGLVSFFSSFWSAEHHKHQDNCGLGLVCRISAAEKWVCFSLFLSVPVT